MQCVFFLRLQAGIVLYRLSCFVVLLFTNAVGMFCECGKHLHALQIEFPLILFCCWFSSDGLHVGFLKLVSRAEGVVLFQKVYLRPRMGILSYTPGTFGEQPLANCSVLM